ncbi:MAG TPA: tRNA lysidine(34) synthetase TilS [Parvibaculum sp.]|jgi:tRNA(Ile)-lysidine synthase
MSAASSSPAPLSAAEFAAHLAALHPSDTLAVAFSGGPDSLALLYLAAQWAKKSKHRKLIVLTVDHGLRPESAKEALACARMAKALGVSHRILVWRGDKPKAGIQAAARDARYRLLAQACVSEGASDLLVAHHLEDQAETFLLRLARGSGVDGLAGMAAVRMLQGDVRLLRPLLDVPRARLMAVLAKAKLEAIQDPSNDNPRFDRVKARRLMAGLSALGLDASRLADTARHMARVRAALEAETRVLLSTHATLAPTGYIEADAAAFLRAPEEIGLRALAEILKCVGGTDYPPRFDALAGLYAALKAGKLGNGRTLNGCKLVFEGKRLVALREAAASLGAAPLRLKTGESGIWDGRFVVSLSAAPKRAGGIEIRSLGSEGLAALKAQGLDAPAGVKSALPALPALWKGTALLAAPHFGTVDPAYRLEVRVLRPVLFAAA